MKKLAILASYNGSALDAILEAINNKKLDLKISVVISNNTNAVVLQKAKKLGLSVHLVNAQTTSNPNEKIFNLLNETQSDYVFLAGYMKKLSSRITNNFSVINSHPALLPKHGGKGMYGHHVHEAVIASKESYSGVTLHEVNERYDEGKIILQKTLALSDDETALTLEQKIKALEKIAIVEALQLCLK